MRAVGIKILKNKLSAYLRMVAEGETVLVVDRDRVVAELIPPHAGRAEQLDDAWLIELVRVGVLRPALSPRSGPPARRPVLPFATLMAELDEDRGERR